MMSVFREVWYDMHPAARAFVGVMPFAIFGGVLGGFFGNVGEIVGVAVGALTFAYLATKNDWLVR